MKNKIIAIIAIIIVIGIMIAVYVIENLYPVIDVKWTRIDEQIKLDVNGDGVEEDIVVTQEQVANNPVANNITLNVNGVENIYRTVYELDTETPIGFTDINEDGLTEIIIKVRSIESSETVIPKTYYRIFNYQNDELICLKTINRWLNEIYFKIKNNTS